jgi:hypothetical protein
MMEFAVFYFAVALILYSLFMMISEAQLEIELWDYELKLGSELIAILWLLILVVFVVVKAIEFIVNFYRSI